MIEALFAVMAVIFVGMMAVILYSWAQNRMQPVVRATAIVLRRRTREIELDVPTNPLAWLFNILGARWSGFFWTTPLSSSQVASASGGETVASTADYYITFSIEGREVELLVPQRVFMTVEDGRRGLLVHQGEWFKHFIPDPPLQDTRQEPPRPSGRPLTS